MLKHKGSSHEVPSSLLQEKVICKALPYKALSYDGGLAVSDWHTYLPPGDWSEADEGTCRHLKPWQTMPVLVWSLGTQESELCSLRLIFQDHHS